MIKNITPENYKNILKVSIIPSDAVFYNLQSVLQKKDISFDEDEALIILPLPEDIRYPSNAKITDAGLIFNYKIGISITDQSPETEAQLLKCHNKRVIVVLHYNNQGKMIIGCNENPLLFLYEDTNSTNPAATTGFNVECAGNTYFTKVSL